MINPLTAAGVAILGYLFGSFSFAKIIGRIVAPGKDISKVRYQVPGRDATIEMNVASATSARYHLGPRYGCLISLLDMVKVVVPTLLVRLWQPDVPYYLITATAGLVGNNWPLYHRFRGGGGESAIIGGLLVVDWLAVVVTNAIGFAVGIAAGSLLVLRWTGFALLVPWFWFVHGDWPHIVYAAVANILYVLAIWKDVLPYFEQKKMGKAPTQAEIGEFLGMGRRFGKMMDQQNLFALLKKMFRRNPAAGSSPPGNP
jgi:acyl phosphate:glycerol-3-phosphate acyltransferase